MRFLIFFLVILVVIGIPVYLFLRNSKKRYNERKASAWKGKLVDKQHSEWEDFDEKHTNTADTLFFQTTDGQQVKINVLPNIYAAWEIGDSAEKVAGEPLPRKLA